MVRSIVHGVQVPFDPFGGPLIEAIPERAINLASEPFGTIKRFLAMSRLSTAAIESQVKSWRAQPRGPGCAIPLMGEETKKLCARKR